MNMRPLLFLAVVGVAFAETGTVTALAPELAPLAARHKADLVAVDQQSAAALARSTPFYLAALEAAEKDALARANVDAVAAIHKEREAVNAGLIGDLIAAPFPPKLPAGLKSSRDALLESFKRLQADSLKLRQRANADYLRALAGLQPRAAGNPELAREIKAESDAVLGVPVTTPEGEVEVTARTGKLINGDFSEADSNGLPVGWKLVKGDGSENSPGSGETFQVAHENSRSLLHTAKDSKDKCLIVRQMVEIPHFAKEAEFKFQVRFYGNDKGKHRLVNVGAIDDKGESIGDKYMPFDLEADPQWKTYSAKNETRRRQRQKEDESTVRRARLPGTFERHRGFRLFARRADFPVSRGEFRGRLKSPAGRNVGRLCQTPRGWLPRRTAPAFHRNALQFTETPYSFRLP